MFFYVLNAFSASTFVKWNIYFGRRLAFAIRSDGGRNLIGWRSQSVWVASAVCVGGVRRLSPKQCI